MIPTSLFFVAIVFQCDALSMSMRQNANILCPSVAQGNCGLFSRCCLRQCHGGSNIACTVTNGQMQGTCGCLEDGANPGNSHTTTNAPLNYPTYMYFTRGNRHTTSPPNFLPNGPNPDESHPHSILPPAPAFPNDFTGGNHHTTTIPTIPSLATGKNQNRDCGRRGIAVQQMRIVHGNPAQVHSWPWQASLRKDNRHICGGSVIDSKRVLTAAHCVSQQDLGLYKVVLGINTLSERATPSQVFEVDQITIHPNYNSHGSYDAAILTLVRSISFSNAIGPVCVAQIDSPSGTNCYVTGWGETQGTGDNNYLQEVSMPLLSRDTCSSHWRAVFDSSMICAGSFDSDSCNGDSGGPLVCPLSDGRYELQGIVSFGPSTGCAMDKPGVYTRVSSILDWINGETVNSG